MKQRFYPNCMDEYILCVYYYVCDQRFMYKTLLGRFIFNRLQSYCIIDHGKYNCPNASHAVIAISSIVILTYLDFHSRSRSSSY